MDIQSGIYIFPQQVLVLCCCFSLLTINFFSFVPLITYRLCKDILEYSESEKSSETISFQKGDEPEDE
ncbi:unnamed protein product [Brassica rapa subsp. narinosa]